MPVVRLATLEDASVIESMMAELHSELKQYGGLILEGGRTAGWVSRCVLQAIGGYGVCLVALDGADLVGTLLAVGVEWPYNSVHDNCALGLGTYVAPAYRGLGIADNFYKTAKRTLRERGFDSYMGAYLTTNTRVQGVLKRNGAVDIETAMVFNLRG